MGFYSQPQGKKKKKKTTFPDSRNNRHFVWLLKLFWWLFVSIFVIYQYAHQPAVNHHRPSVGQGLRLDSPNKSQQPGGVIGHAMVRPAREVKLSNLPDLMSPPLRKHRVIMSQDRETTVRGQRCRETSFYSKYRAGLNANTHFIDKVREEGWAKFLLSYSKLDVQGCCALISLPTVTLVCLSRSFQGHRVITAPATAAWLVLVSPCESVCVCHHGKMCSWCSRSTTEAGSSCLSVSGKIVSN